MARKADTPCAGGCGRLLWSGPKSLPAGERTCRSCRADAATDAAADDPAALDPPPVEPVGVHSGPSDGFGPRGRRLWRAMRAQATLSPVEVVLLEEACRIADRCDRLDALLCGDEDTWMTLRARDDDGSIVEVHVDKALAEARQQALAYKQIVSELRQSRGTDSSSKPEASGSDDLAQRREDRRRAAAGL